jgi:hypothetical protein
MGWVRADCGFVRGEADRRLQEHRRLCILATRVLDLLKRSAIIWRFGGLGCRYMNYMPTFCGTETGRWHREDGPLATLWYPESVCQSITTDECGG